jgi:TnpA family transposase
MQGSYSRKQLIEAASLTEDDLQEVSRCRGAHNRLGFGYQLGFIRLFNRLPAQQPFEVTDEIVTFVGVQLGIDRTLIADYSNHRDAISDHQIRIRDYLKLGRLGEVEMQNLEAFLFEEACRLEHTAALQARVQYYLKAQRILLPAESTLIRIIGEQRQRARERIYEQITADLPGKVAGVLDELLQVPLGEKASPLQRIKANPRNPSPEAMLALLQKLQLIETTGILQVDLSWLSGNYQRALFHYVNQCSIDRLREVVQPRRNAALMCFLWQSYRDAVDQAVDMYDKLITWVHTQAEADLDEQLRQQRKALRSSLATLKSLGAIILDEQIADVELRARLFEEVPRDELAAQVEALDDWVTGKKSDAFYGVISRFSYLRRFAPPFLHALDFKSETGGDNPCLEALAVLKELNAANKRTLPADAPTAFVPKALQRFIRDQSGKLQKSAWECALLTQIKEDIRAGNLSVGYSKRFGRFDDFFISDAQWAPLREGFFQRAGLPQDPAEVPNYLQRRLNNAYDRFLASAPSNHYAIADESGWHLSVDPTEKLDPLSERQLDELKDWLASHMRWIKLPELLIEVDNELGFTHHFMTPAQRQNRSVDDICMVLAAVMAHGCNIGLYTMAQLVQGIGYKSLKRVSDWQLIEETQRAALTALVSAISGLDTSATWGAGKTSASDGQRFALPRRVLQRTYSPRIRDFALEFYTFLADNYAPYYTMPVECTDRDAPFVLDGLLYNETDLDLEEHYTDTHGYIEVNFTAFNLLGKRFYPRIRGLQHQRIYRIGPERDYGMLTALVDRADSTIDTAFIAEHWDRMGQFYASLEQGHTTASVALKRLAGFTTKNRFYRANRDLGRIFKTEFILKYMSEPQLRRRIRRGLLKVDQLHALARDVYYGRRGRINAHELHEQMNSCSCLTLILACIIYWQAREIDRVLNECDPQSNGINVSLLEHVSPIEWENVVLYGEYVINRDLIRSAVLLNT